MHRLPVPPAAGLLLACLTASTLSAVPATALAQARMNERLAPPPAAGAAPVTVHVARRIHTVEPANPTATAVAVSGGRILAVGSLDEVRRALGDRPFTVDETFRSKVLVPGLIDQ
ncbi:MAG TPA: hypothetical protein VFM45_06230, partial [Anaeromyxobacteraceae bacterium]|nr:hypothetical protein [Anaeromyxobacteraceae bacterium]